MSEDREIYEPAPTGPQEPAAEALAGEMRRLLASLSDGGSDGAQIEEQCRTVLYELHRYWNEHGAFPDRAAVRQMLAAMPAPIGIPPQR